MKRFLVLLVFFSVLLSSVTGVFADEVNLTTNTTVIVEDVVNLSISPFLINFDTSIPTKTVNGTTINFDTDNSNANMTVSISSVTGKPFDTGLKFDGTLWSSKTFVFNCNLDLEGKCNYSSVTSIPMVTIPGGFANGTYHGTVVYSVNNGIQNLTQNLTVPVNQTINVAITPAIVDFGSIFPGQEKNGSIINFNALANTNADLIIVVAEVTGKPFDTGLKLDGLTPSNFNVTMNCNKTGAGVCSYVSQSATPSLYVPVGFRAGTSLGTITYTITGTMPPA